MDRYNMEAYVSSKILSAMIAHDETIKFSPLEDDEGEWYKADDVADLAERCQRYLSHIGCHCDTWNDEHTKCGCGLFQLKAELEQIAGK